MNAIKFTQSLFFTFLVAISFQLAAQTVEDSVVLGPGYASQAYYQLSSGDKTYTALADWHLAFENRGLQSAGIWINEALGMKAYLYTGGDTAIFGNALDTTGIAGWPTLHNSVTRWDKGALNSAAAPPFDFGWGNYHQATNTVYGDSVYVLKVNDTTYVQFKVNTEDQYYYTFSFADLDGNNVVTDSVARTGSSAKNFGYYNLLTEVDSDPEPTNTDWELLFTTSLTTQELAPGYFANSAGMTYLNYSLNAAKVSGVDAATADYQTATLASTNMTVIGDSYRYFPQPTGPWTTTDSTAYFVETADGSIYRLVFTGFSGSATGIIKFNKTLVFDATATGITTPNTLNVIELYPNPVANKLHLVVAPKQAAAYNITIVNLAGQTVYGTSTEVEVGLQTIQISTADLATGIYVIQMTNGQSVSQQKFVKY